jgi:hypothetical protein
LQRNGQDRHGKHCFHSHGLKIPVDGGQ